jgi:hypothetical protein
LLLLVILPRLVLAVLAWRRENRLAKDFPIDLARPYFSRLCAGLTPDAAASLWVCPYSYQVNESQRASLNEVARLLLGEQASLALAESTAYGEAAQAGPAPAGALRAALFSLSATPEQENHGAFLDQLRRESAGAAIALVDESAYLERLGAQAGARLAARASLWRQFCAQHQTPVAIINLREPQRHTSEIEGLLVQKAGA